MRKKNTALALLKHVCENNGTTSWGALNTSMRQALNLAIGANLQFTPQTFRYADDHFRTGYWLGEHGWDYPYALAIAVGNNSFIEAYEAWKGMEPFFGNDVRTVDGCGFHHRNGGGRRQRERLALSSWVVLNGARFEVTSIRKDQIILCSRNGEKRTILKCDHNKCRELFPAPKKVKKGETNDSPKD